ncbi:chemotaxis protein [Ruminococcaceae bacterium OttesenSCG-928-I18]|nr:chemotaxis protein [Ruminococcaceae bacterium OttesenSCG-928-I18]
MSNQSEILLESGTNELEIMEFSIAGKQFGINVAKVQEIMKFCPVNPMQKAHPDIEGVFKPRDEVITVVNLARHLSLGESENPDFDIFIITNFSQETYAFHVHEVVGINRISWQNLQKPDDIIYGGDEGVATAIAEYDGRLITILDFEKIIREISPKTGIDLEAITERPENHIPIVVAEDSMLLSRLVLEGLEKAGYKNVTYTKHGLEAWEYLEEVRKSGKPVKDYVKLVITDIEMPYMDGHHLLKRIREDADFKDIPVVIFSSLINEQAMLKGGQLGATGQFSKPQLAELIDFVDELVRTDGV